MKIRYKFRFEPIVSLKGNIIAYELLSDVRINNLDLEVNFSYLSVEDKIRIFNSQLSLAENIGSYIENGIVLTINIDVDVGSYIINSKGVMERIRALSNFIRLEISEDFIFDGSQPFDFIIRGLGYLCPLWADDFGSGNTNFSMLKKYQFEFVKLDKNFFWKHELSPGLIMSLVSAVKEYSQGIIVEGVDSIERDKIALQCNFTGKQGFLWKSENLINLSHYWCV